MGYGVAEGLQIRVEVLQLRGPFVHQLLQTLPKKPRSGSARHRRERHGLPVGQAKRPQGVRGLAESLLVDAAVVYGKHALALPIPGAVKARVATSGAGSTIRVPQWGIATGVSADDPSGIGPAVLLIMREFGVEDLYDRIFSTFCIGK